MLCPYCNSELEEGVIQSPHEIRWQRSRRFFETRMKGDMVLSKHNVWRGSAVRAFYCNGCQKIVIDCSDCDINKKHDDK